jgi:uncharacterized membrane protein HdeD (DUF308 family)
LILPDTLQHHSHYSGPNSNDISRGTTVFLILLIEMAFLIDGISRVVHAFGDKENRGCSRGFSIGVGMIMIVTGIPGRRVGIRLL